MLHKCASLTAEDLDSEGKFVGRLHVSGAEIVHNGKEVQIILVNGMPLTEETWYRVASFDYLQRGSRYPTLASEQKVTYRAEKIKDVIQQYVS
ncbi:hypothetical protein [Planococcus lenghuensis]|uniref:5'-Nucleotidase C-terminal domain-containing protein n=1 Tax=Planococcus lenghuensis TaxID=2213202 RepID=A0A1Q2KW05_9BACL|nr:hypothetical protein [Planococcus lenghuensis]AQQ52323.1 hypothetical protein B0X71_03830 [Planococcus lenghuensis]